jgi:hypothetical protein
VAQTEIKLDQSTEPKAQKEWSWPTINPAPKQIWRPSQIQLLDTLPELKSQDGESESVLVFRRGYLPSLVSPLLSTPAKPTSESSQTSQAKPKEGDAKDELKNGSSPQAQETAEPSRVHLTAGEITQHELSLNIRPRRRDVEVSVNGVSVDAKSTISLPMGVPSTITVTRPNYQSHHILIRPTPYSPKRISVHLKRATVSKPIITLSAHLWSAQLTVIDREGGEHVIGDKMGRYTYQPAQEGAIVLRASVRKGGEEVWRLNPKGSDAYTVHFDNLVQGKGKLKINGKARFKAMVTPLASTTKRVDAERDTPEAQDVSTSSSSKSTSVKKLGTRLPYTMELEAQEVLVTLTDSIDESQYQFVTSVFDSHEVVWQISRERSSIDQSRSWRVDAKRLRQYRGRKRRSSSQSKSVKKEQQQPAKPKTDLEMPKLNH